MVTYLLKSDASEGFNQIIDFLNGSSIKYLLTVNDITRLQALVDKKKVVVTEATIREALHLDDEEGVECLPNKEIFAELTRMGYEKPSTKLTFYKAFFSSHLVRNVDSPSKFYMYPCFLQLMIRKQVGDLSTHITKYTSPTLTQKVFANIRRVGKGFSGVKTPLFKSMLIEQQVAEEGDADENVEEVSAGDAAEGDVSAAHGEVPTVAEEPSISSLRPPTPPPQPSQDILSTSQVQPTPPQSPQEDMEVANVVKEAVKEAKVDESAQDQERQAESQAKIYKINMDHANKVLSMQEDETKPAKVQEVVDVITTAKLFTEVVTAAKRATKRQKLDEEVEELKRHLQIVPNEDDDVYTEATPLARKVPVVDYQIIKMNNKPFYKIIRADDTHQLYVSFLSLLRNFNREDYEALWSLVKERFSTTKPKNFFDDFLLVTLGEMFEKPDIHAQIWKTRRNVHGPAKVK
nr:hypothetical protein [Tanacetum cinerariifolium]